MFKTITVGFDGSEPSENALRLACDLAGKYDSEIHVLHTPKPETVAFAMGAVAGYHAATTMPSHDEVMKTAQTLLDRAKTIATEAGQSNIKTEVGEGDAADALLTHAKAVGSDLIVTGRRGLGNLSALVLGSTSQRVGHLSHCAHLTVM
ncbi:Stress response protein NhaX [Roseobacter fucihabitans]|uniref:Stress response protein NhaX n=1 Tax=Roseobacter fucihabitans TaxID=1537242 RepID=A0ABZ2BWE9_9RHOB|nr:universal stress protein [Roseobacter litoralis]MBC6966863.1 Stress response protein NhaX [Roseobacter litoralis]